MNHTEHYQLSQWEYPDRILMSDFNSDNAKIDAALAGEAAERKSSLAAGLALHPSAELICGGTLETAAQKVELDLSGLDWSRYLFLAAEAESDTAVRFIFSTGLSGQRCTVFYSSNSKWNYFSNFVSVRRVMLLIPVFYNPARLASAFGFAYLGTGSTDYCQLCTGGAMGTLSACKKLTLSTETCYTFSAGDTVRLWGVK